MAVILETSLGDMTIDLYTEERPRCCMNFLKLCKIKYYNLCLIHSVQRNLVAQTGDPTGTGKGGQSIYAKLYGEQAAFFEPEYKPRIKHKKVGTVSMVNNGENLHGSQFFITTGSDVDYLDNVHTVFGEVSEGHDILQKINESIVDGEHRPFKDIRIFHTVVLDDPYDDPAELSAYIPDRSPEPTKEQLASNRIGVDEDLDDMEGKTEAELTKMLADREAKANAQILEMVGDLPDAEVAPEDNVLFVCKLNPVTTEDDLEIIFSRFGEIKGCEVIKDKKTEESLQYAFIEFEKVADCEAAYFKMDNVIIDDRRIHVDFSQSVAKIKWDRKGKGAKDQNEERPSFIIKDKSRRDDRYDLVFSDNEDGGASSSKKKHKKKKKKHKKHKQSDSDSSEDEAPAPPKRKEREVSRSRSPPPKKQYADKQRQRRSSPERNEGTDRRTDRDRDRNREQGGDRGRDRNRGRDKESDRYTEGRDRREDRQQDRRKDRQRDRSRDRDSDRRRDR